MIVVVVLLVLGTVPVLLGTTDSLEQPPPLFAQDGEVRLTVSNGSVTSQSLLFRHDGGQDVPVENLEISLNAGSNQTVIDPPQAGALADGTWSEGETIPLALNSSEVCTGTGSVSTELIYNSGDASYKLGEYKIPVSEGGFTIRNGQVVPVTEYTAEATVIGTGFTYGANGPRIPISLTFDIGGVKSQPFPGDVNDGANPRRHTFSDQPAGAPISVRAVGDHNGRFITPRTRWSNSSTGYVRVLRDGDRPPNLQAFGGQATVASYVGPYVDANGRVDLADNQAIYLFELSSSQTGATADFQDVVVLVSLTTQSQTVDTYTTVNGKTGILCPAGG